MPKPISLCKTQHSISKALLRYKVGFIRDGKRYLSPNWTNNLILDSGLNKIGSGVFWAPAFSDALFGNAVSPDPVRRDSSPVTFSTVGNICTASGNFFEIGDVGRLIKFNDIDGTEAYITNFTNATQVTLSISPSPAIAAQTSTIWYVNQTQLNSYYSGTVSYGSAGGDNGTSFVGNVQTMKRTYIGAPAVSNTTLTEIGFNNGAANVDLFDRDIIVGGVPIVTGDQPLAVAELIIEWNPAPSPVAVPNVASGYDSAGDIQITGLLYPTGGGASFVDVNGNSNLGSGVFGPFMDPSCNFNLGVIVGTDFSIPSYTEGIGPSPAGVIVTGATAQPYSAGNFYRDFVANYSVSQANGTIYGYGMFRSNSSINAGLLHHFDTPFVKNSTQVLSFTIRKSWQRILFN